MKTYFYIFATLAFLATASPSYGNGGKTVDLSLIHKVPELKQACETASKPGWDSGITAQMLQASFDYEDCLIGIIQQLLGAYYSPNNHTFIKRLNDIARNINELYWNIYCVREGYCGTFDRVLSIADRTAFIEDVLQTMTDTIELKLK